MKYILWFIVYVILCVILFVWEFKIISFKEFFTKDEDRENYEFL